MERSREHTTRIRPISTSPDNGDASAERAPLGVGSRAAKRTFDVVLSGALLLLTAPLFAVLAVLIVIDSPGGVLFRCDRVGFRGRPLSMLKFRKMRKAVSGSALTVVDDDRFTRIGRLLSTAKLDELPQLWNVLRGDMSLVGPRPEDKRFVDLHPERYQRILSVRPGMTGLSQLAFARESEILDSNDREGHYVCVIFPQKVALDFRYATTRTLGLDVKILLWTAAATIIRRDVAVNRRTTQLGLRRRPRPSAIPTNAPRQMP